MPRGEYGGLRVWGGPALGPCLPFPLRLLRHTLPEDQKTRYDRIENAP